MVTGIFVGSCVYDDICTFIAQIFPQTFNPTNCPSELADYDIDCTCPFNSRARHIDLVDALLNLPDLNDPNILSGFLGLFFGKGEYEITIKTEDPLGKLACLRIKYSIKPSVIGK